MDHKIVIKTVSNEACSISNLYCVYLLLLVYTCILVCANGHKRVTIEVRGFVSHMCYMTVLFCMYENFRKNRGKGKAVPLEAWTVLEGSRKLRLPDFVTTAQDGGRLSALRTSHSEE